MEACSNYSKTRSGGITRHLFSERHPVGAQILNWSRGQVTLMRPTPSTRAPEAIMRDLMATRDGATYFAERIWGISVRYDLSSSHPLVGCSAPDLLFGDGTRLGELLRKGNGLLVDFDAGTPLRGFADTRNEQIMYLAEGAQDQLALNALLVRPDGIVAWAADGVTDHEELSNATFPMVWRSEERSEDVRPFAPLAKHLNISAPKPHGFLGAPD